MAVLYSDLYTYVTELSKADKVPNAITSTVKQNLIYAAVETLSNDIPLMKVLAYTGNTTGRYDLPTDWDDEASSVYEVEWPINQDPKTVISPSHYMIDLLPDDGYQLRFETTLPSSGETFWLRYTIPYTIGSVGISNVPNTYKNALAYKSTSLWCDAIANYFSTKTDANIPELSPLVNFQDRVTEWEGRAKQYYRLYKESIASKKNSETGVIGSMNQDTNDNMFFER
jgi:hypothetical protein